jgi:hypothetical protein
MWRTANISICVVRYFLEINFHIRKIDRHVPLPRICILYVQI